MKDFFEDFFKYLLFRDMGELGEGCFMSVAYWAILIIVVYLVLHYFGVIS